MASMAGLARLRRLLLTPSYSRYGVKASHAFKIMANCGPIISNLSPRKDHSHAPFTPLFGRTIAMWHRYAGIHDPLFVRLPASTFRQCVAKAPQKQQLRISI